LHSLLAIKLVTILTACCCMCSRKIFSLVWLVTHLSQKHKLLRSFEGCKRCAFILHAEVLVSSKPFIGWQKRSTAYYEEENAARVYPRNW
jgi:hypothetical protein